VKVRDDFHEKGIGEIQAGSSYNLPPGYKEDYEVKEVVERDEDGIIINGEWDGESIWRHKTVTDRFAEII
jgi:hypothetical protein